MEPSGSEEFAELNATVSGTMPDVGVPDATAIGGALGVPAGNTSSVMLCAGAVKFTLEFEKLRSARCVMAFADVNWYTWAEPVAAKLLRAIETGVDPVRYL